LLKRLIKQLTAIMFKHLLPNLRSGDFVIYHKRECQFFKLENATSGGRPNIMVAVMPSQGTLLA
jgi:hypothetical protein